MNENKFQDVIDETLKIEKRAQIVCTACGWESTVGNSLNVHGEELKEYSGDYCMKCYAKWVSQNITKMIFK